MARPGNKVETSKATYSLPTTQVEFIEARAKQQTKVLKEAKAKHPVVFPSHLVSLAISFYEKWADVVENTMDWKGKEPIIWPDKEDQAGSEPLSEIVFGNPEPPDAEDSPKPNAKES